MFGSVTNLHGLELWRRLSAFWQSVFNGSSHFEREPANQRETEKKALLCSGLSGIDDQHMKVQR
jgi:hypothetical protein